MNTTGHAGVTPSLLLSEYDSICKCRWWDTLLDRSQWLFRESGLAQHQSLADDRPDPMVLRWVGWLTLVCTVAWAPGLGANLVHDGPMAWNGGITFWVPMVAFFI